MIPKVFKNKVIVELMVFDTDKDDVIYRREKTIIIANRLIDWKVTHLFVEAFSEFRAQLPTAYKLIIIGEGPYYKKIMPFIDGKTIIHYKRFQKREDMLSILKSSTLFVSTSLRDSGAASLLEAMSFGVPFLVSASGAHKVYLERNVGYGFDLESFKKDKIKIKEILKVILTDENILKEESNKVSESYSSYFSEKEKTKRIEKILS